MNYKEKFTYKFLKFISRHLNKVDNKRRVLYTNVIAGFVYKFIPVRKRVALENIQTAFSQHGGPLSTIGDPSGPPRKIVNKSTNFVFFRPMEEIHV